jgi:predicted ATPase with chaperone activity
MLFKALSAAVYGIDASLIDVEVDYSGVVAEQDHFHTVGLPDAAVRESRDRVRAAIKNSGYLIPPTHITINLAPADMKKEGAGFDLPIAVGILGAYGALRTNDLSRFLLVGELGLDGGVRPVPGILPVAILAREKNIPYLILPAANAAEAAVVEEALETTKIHSVAGVLDAAAGLVTQRPFRSPHHTISDAGLIGGGIVPRPGEVSLAHNGLLFLDELPEFPRNVLEVLRQPLEDHTVTIARASLSLSFPARFMLAAAMNP